MAFDQAAVNALISAATSHALKTGAFRSVSGHEPKSAPGSGLRASLWAQDIRPTTSSGLAATSGIVTLNLRVYGNMLQKPEDDIDPRLIAAVSLLMDEYTGDFTFGGTIRQIDLLGAYGTPLSAQAGYVDIDGSKYRIMTMTIPCVINDLWVQGGIPSADEEPGRSLQVDSLGVTGGASIGGALTVGGLVTANGVTDWFNVKKYGATGNGATDDTTAIRAAFTAATAVNGVVYFPAGTYLISNYLPVTTGIRVIGDGPAATVILTTSASSVFNFTANSLVSSPGEFSGFTVDATGADIFHNANLFGWSFHDLKLIQRSAGNYVFLQQTPGSLIQCTFTNVVTQAYGAPRTVPAWKLYSSIGGGIANNTWLRCFFGLNGNGTTFDTSQYLVDIAATGSNTSHENQSFRDCYFEHPFGGCVRSLSGYSLTIDGCQVWDIVPSQSYGGSSATLGNSLLYVGEYSGARASQGTAIRSTGRNLTGPDGSSTFDIYCESTTNGVLVENYFVLNTPTFQNNAFANLNSCTDVTLISNQSATTENSSTSLSVTNPATTGVTISGGSATLTGAFTAGSLAGGAAPVNTVPSDLGFKGWAYDPVVIRNGASPGTGIPFLIKVKLPVAQSITSIYLYINALGNTLTSGQNFVGLYSPSGTLIGKSADQTSAWGSTGLITAALVSGPFSAGPGFAWVAILANGTTAPSFGISGNANGTMLNGPVAAGSYRFATNGSGLTALANSITPGSNSVNSNAYWAAVG